MPDELVLCFTLNGQSLDGAAAVAASVAAQRVKPNAEAGLRIWPVPMRVEMAEKDKLDAARDLAHYSFDRHLGKLSPAEIERYWSRIEVLYQPFYAYEEVLAVFADWPRRSNSLLSAFETITEYVTGGSVVRMDGFQDDYRVQVMSRFARAPRLKAQSASGPRRIDPAPLRYQGVMLSSTFTDLKDHRAALTQAIKSQGLADLAMENDSAKVVDVIESSLQMVRDASAYIGVISRTYGQTPTDLRRNPHKLSITELEFNEAQR